MNLLIKKYYKLKEKKRKRYICNKTRDKDYPVYDRKKKLWFYRYFLGNSEFIEEGDINYIMSEYARGGLIYVFNHKGVNSEYGDHAHNFDEVLQAAYRYPFSFHIEQEYRHQYSEQQLDLLDRIVKNRQRDIKKKRDLK